MSGINGSEANFLDDFVRPKRLLLRPSVLTILASYRCTAACEHCCFDSNPHITQRLSLAEITTFIREAVNSSDIELVVFSGGECFLLGEDLNQAIGYCRTLGLRTRCVTNAYWAKSAIGGRRRLEKLRADGLNELNISTGDFHQEFVPLDAVINAASCSVKLGLDQTLIVVEVQKNRATTADVLRKHPRIAEFVTLGEDKFKIIESPWISTSLDVAIPQPDAYLLNRQNVHLRGPCGSMFRTLVLTPSRKVGLCCGLTREQIPEMNHSWQENGLETVLDDGGRDFMKIWITVDGPERILAWAASKNSSIDWENKYSHHCQVCLALYADEKVRNTIREHYKERVEDVLMRYCMLVRYAENHSPDSVDSAHSVLRMHSSAEPLSLPSTMVQISTQKGI